MAKANGGYSQKNQAIPIHCAECDKLVYLAELQHSNKDGLLICDDCHLKEKKKCQKLKNMQTKS